jgi:F-box and WD-40 domain protein 7
MVQVLEGHLEAVLALAVGNGHLISGSYDTTVSTGFATSAWAASVRHSFSYTSSGFSVTLAMSCLMLLGVKGAQDPCLPLVQVRFWALDSLRCVRKCEGHEDAVRVLAVADGRVFSGSYDGSIGVWL